MTREEAIDIVRNIYQTDKEKEALCVLIPELRESEDERLRRSLVGYFKKFKPQDMWDDRFSMGDILAYLEKQKEHLAGVRKMIEPQDYSDLTDLERAILRGFLSAGVDNVPVAIIKETANECKRAQTTANENANAEWGDSVAKEMFIKALERAVEQTKNGYELTDCDKHSWWEDFKAYSGINPAEWSKEDEQMLTGIIARGSSQVPPYDPALRGEQIKWLMNRLKFLCPRPHLKPSEVVEGLFWHTPFPTICLDDCRDYNFKDNQKVRVIIVEEESK